LRDHAIALRKRNPFSASGTSPSENQGKTAAGTDPVAFSGRETIKYAIAVR
jgi:hypothetical protein